METEKPAKPAVRQRADQIRAFRCRHLIAVIEDPTDLKNIGTILRNVNALGVEKAYVIDPQGHLPDDWEAMRETKRLSKASVSAVKWSFVKRFDSTEACLKHLQRYGYASIVTSPHTKGARNASLDAVDFTVYPKLAVWFGNEARGISDLAIAHSDLCVSIPMFGMIESLNLGTTSGIVLYEVTRQRRAYQARYTKRRQRGAKFAAEPLGGNQ